MNENFGPNLVLLEKIAAGGMAEVFRARLMSSGGFDKVVAVKRILPNLASDPIIHDNFQREISLISKLQHPNIVQVFHTGEWQEYLYLVMEYVNGKDLNQFILHFERKQFKVPISIACHILNSVASGLKYAHTLRDDSTDGILNIIHRDINPRNIMLGYNGEVKIVDFGIAKAVGCPHLTHPGTFKGTLRYASPEQAKDTEIDTRSDIFSLGGVLYELLTGQHVFKGDTAYQVITNIVSCKVIPPSKLRPDIPPELEEIILKALQKDPATRYQTAGMMLSDLIKFQRKYSLNPRMEDLATLMETVFQTDIIEEKKVRKSPSSLSATGKTTKQVNNLFCRTTKKAKTLKSLAFKQSKPQLTKIIVLFILGIIFSFLYLMKPLNKSPRLPDPSPVARSSEYVLWLKGDNLSHLSSPNIREWPCAFDSSLKAFQLDFRRQPSLENSSLNNKKTVTFDGRNDFLVLDSISPYLQGLETASFIIVARIRRINKKQSILAIQGKQRLKDILRLDLARNGFPSLTVKRKTEVNTKKIIAPGNFNIYTIILQPSQAFVYLNGQVVLRSGIFVPRVLQQTNYVSLGQEWDEFPSDFLDGSIAEFIIIDHSLTEIEQSRIEKRLSKKYLLGGRT